MNGVEYKIINTVEGCKINTMPRAFSVRYCKLLNKRSEIASLTSAACVFVNALKSVDLPTLGSPTIPIFREPRQAFGTGTHHTTQMIISDLLELDLKDKHVLDCGCGTGILGITASKLGADEVVGYDIDEWSVTNSQHNAELNHVENIQILEGDAKVINHICGLFDVVLANINRNILLHDLPAWKEVLNFDGILIMSGFFEKDAALLIDAAEQLGFQLVDKKVLSSWACLEFKLAAS